MATLSAGDLTNLRTTTHKSTLYLSILQPATLLSALVNNGSIARGARTIAYDTGTGSATGYGVISAAVTAGSNANIGTALMLEVVTAYGTEIIRIKSISGDETSGTITVGENAIVWANNQVLTVKHFFQIAPIPPAIRSGVFYKDFDRVFVTAFATQANPVANIGQHFAGFLSAGSLALSLNAGGSYAVASGASISSHLWACVHNGGGTAGISFSSTTSATPTLTITQADTYWLSYTATDSNGKKQTTYRCIFVYDPTGTQPYTDFTISSLNGDWNSGQWRCSLNLTGTITQTVVPDGSLAVIWMQNYFDGAEGYINLWSPHGDNIVYTGYIWSDSDQDDWDAGAGQASFEIISPVAYLDAITDYGTVSLEAKTSPVLWSDYASTLTVGRGVHHLSKWDTTILDCCDVYGLTANTYGVKVLEFTEDTLLQRINGVAYQRGIHAKMVSDRLGRLHLVQDSQMLNTAARAALDTIFTLTKDDISGGVNVVRNATDVRAFADMDGFTYSHPTSTPFISMIPGYIESTISYNLPEFRGTGSATQKQQVLNASGGQTDSNERVGRVLALENVSPREVRFDCRGNYLGAFDIVPNQGWYSWGVADNALKRQLALNSTKLVCRSVTHTQIMGDNVYSGILQTVDVALQPEAIGPDGIPGNYPTGYPAKKTIAPTWTEPAAHLTTTYGYAAGGQVGGISVVTTDRLTFATGIMAAFVTGNLPIARGSYAGLSDTMTYGYWAGGRDGSANYLDTTDRMVLSTGVSTAHSAIISDQKEALGSLSDGNNNGYFCGGFTFSAVVDNTDKIAFSSGVISASAVSNLSADRGLCVGLSDSGTYGYMAGGHDSLSVEVVTADRLTYATGVMAANATSNLSVARSLPGGVSDKVTYGYWAGGTGGAGVVVTADRITFATGVTAANSGSNLSTASQPNASTGDGATYGYFLNASTTHSDKITFATGVTADDTASNLSAQRAFSCGISDGVA